MNYDELREEVLTLALQLGDPEGLEYETYEQIAHELKLSRREIQEILTESLFDIDVE